MSLKNNCPLPVELWMQVGIVYLWHYTTSQALDFWLCRISKTYEFRYSVCATITHALGIHLPVFELGLSKWTAGHFIKGELQQQYKAGTLCVLVHSERNFCLLVIIHLTSNPSTCLCTLLQVFGFLFGSWPFLTPFPLKCQHLTCRLSLFDVN